MNALESLRFFHCELWLLGGAFTLLFADFFLKNKKILGILGILVLASAALAANPPPKNYDLFFGLFQLDPITHFFRYAALGIVGVTIAASLAYKPLRHYEGEYYALFLFMTLGLILMAASRNLLMIFLSIEFVSIISYLLVGFLKKCERSKEAAIKYLLFGSVASGMMLFGMSLLFGASGSLELPTIQNQLVNPAYFPLGVVAFLLFLVGVGFKISMAPFHLWAPDVYEGAPTPVTAFLTVAPKALGFAVMLRLFITVYPSLGGKWVAVISILSILTMTIGNITAIAQTNIKRLLAYSSIAQAGYILMGLASTSKTGIMAVLIYLVAYTFTNLGAFIVVIMVSNHCGNDKIESYRGLARRAPMLAAALTLFLLSLAGIPPLAGFIGKFYVFAATIQAGLLTLAIAAAINSAVAAYYYFKIVRVMYLVPVPEDDSAPMPHSVPLLIVLYVMLAATLVIGVIPAPLLGWVKNLMLL